MLGTSLSVCGGVLVGWAICDQRPELWDLGLPLALCGQVALVAGLALHLAGVGRDHHRAVGRLAEVDRQLASLQRSTAGRDAAQAGAQPAFYTHLAEGAGPHILLADLKGQLDQLAARLERPF